MQIYFRLHLEWLYLFSCAPQRQIQSHSSFTNASPPKMGFEGQKETLSWLIFVLSTHRFWHQFQNLPIDQNLKCGKATAHTGAELSGTKSCGFSEEKKKLKKVLFHFRCFSVWESSCSQEVNVKGSLFPLGKGQLLYSKKTAPQNKNAVLAPAFLPDFVYDWKGFFLSSTGTGKYYIQFLPR